MPDERKVHTHPIPRTGGLAVFTTFFLTLFISSFFNTAISRLFFESRSSALLLAGAAVTFGIGFFDDFKRLGPKIKFAFQILGASLAFLGGARIGTVFWSIGLSGCTICSYGSGAGGAGGIVISGVRRDWSQSGASGLLKSAVGVILMKNSIRLNGILKACLYCYWQGEKQFAEVISWKKLT